MSKDHIVGFMFGVSVGFMTAYLVKMPEAVGGPGKAVGSEQEGRPDDGTKQEPRPAANSGFRRPKIVLFAR